MTDSIFFTQLWFPTLFLRLLWINLLRLCFPCCLRSQSLSGFVNMDEIRWERCRRFDLALSFLAAASLKSKPWTFVPDYLHFTPQEALIYISANLETWREIFFLNPSACCMSFLLQLIKTCFTNNYSRSLWPWYIRQRIMGYKALVLVQIIFVSKKNSVVAGM